MKTATCGTGEKNFPATFRVGGCDLVYCGALTIKTIIPESVQHGEIQSTMTFAKFFIYSLFIAAILATSVGCGRKGDLVLPDNEKPPATKQG
jgi:hypothetical protein